MPRRTAAGLPIADAGARRPKGGGTSRKGTRTALATERPYSVELGGKRTMAASGKELKCRRLVRHQRAKLEKDHGCRGQFQPAERQT
jgi:hypothetical protein